MNKAISKVQAVVLAIVIIIALISVVYYITSQHPAVPPTPTGKVKDTLVIAVPADALHLDPGTMQVDNTGFAAISDMYEGLVDHKWRASADGSYLEMVPDEFEGLIAERWEHSPDYRVWTFYLRKGLKFHSGNPITAREVVWSFKEYHLKLFTGSVLGMAGITEEGIEAIDDYTVRFTLIKPCIAFLQYICQSATGVIMDMDLILQHGGITPMTTNQWLAKNDAGSGPYKLVCWTPGVEIVLTAFEDYWREGYPKTKKIIYRIVPEIETAEMGLIKGDIDIIWNIPAKDVERMNTTEGIKVISAPSATTVFIQLRTEQETGLAPPAFGNIKVREALRYTIPYNQIMEKILYNKAARLGSIVPSYFPDYMDVYTSKYYYDLDKAKALLEEAGYTNGFEFNVVIGSGMSHEQEDIIVAWQSELTKIGVKLTITKLPAPTYLQLLQNHQLSLWFVDWTSYTADPFYQLFWFTTSDALASIGITGALGVNPCDFTDMKKDPSVYPELQNLWLQGHFEQDTARRSNIAKQLQQLAIDKAYQILLYSPYINIAMRDNVRDYYVHLEIVPHPQTVYAIAST